MNNDEVPHVMIAVMMIGAFGIAAINDWQKRRLVERAWQRGERPKTSYFNNRTDWRFVIVMSIVLIVAAVAGIQWKNLTPQQRAALMEVGPWLGFAGRVLLWLMGGMLAMLVALIVFLKLLMRLERLRNRELVQAELVALQGNVDKAIELVQQVLDGPGKQPGTAKYLASLYRMAAFEGMRGNWNAALVLMEQLDPYATTPQVFLATKSLIFWKLGRHDEAEQCLREAADANPTNGARQAALGLYLFDTGRINEATDVSHTLDGMQAARYPSEVEIDLAEHLRQLMNARRGITPEVTQAQSDTVMRQLLISSMDGVIFRDWKGPLPASAKEPSDSTSVT